ncbi:PREDICTED: calcitonin-like [Propithecus coquereli]|uniref:calcitonin-like n=1 Tax=Propithecus coquereli TaxID=379532 RepID=UPI00063F795B|nr:PREDICTED: calcitonin-like [Propithecus coquereli]
MGFQKFSLILALSILVLYQVGSLQAVPFRSNLESIPGLDMLSKKQARRLLAALAQDYVQMKAGDLEQEPETEDSSVDSARTGGCGNLSTCLLDNFIQDLHKLKNSNRTDTGPGSPGKKRDMARHLERDHRPHVSRSLDAD